ncbi:hypothetical protein FQA39_LY18499 [Lamprigera yunnana]|nr:hypothetical protein FQA39_LY18499 [Lamprigera yunnana]
MWMLYAQEHWTKCYDLKSAVERLYEELGALEFDADHEAIYGMERYYTVQQCEELRDKYKIGRKVCRKFLQGRTCSQCLVKRISEIGLRHFLDTVNKYIKDCSDSSSSSDEEVFKAVEQNGEETTEEEEESKKSEKFDADHEAIYGMERYYTVQQCEELRDKYKIGRKVCRKFLQGRTCSQCLVKRISEIGLRHFLDTVNKYIKDCSDSSSSSDEEVFKAVEQNGEETTEEEEESKKSESESVTKLV